jgi:hypothetical protein
MVAFADLLSFAGVTAHFLSCELLRRRQFSTAVRPFALRRCGGSANLAGVMQQRERNHDAAAVELAAGWIAICATCGWVGETYGSGQKAEADSAHHIAEAPSGPESALVFLADAPRSGD